MFHSIVYVLTPKYYSPSWLAQLTTRGGVRRKPHTYIEVQNEYMIALHKLVLDEDELAQVRSQLSKYINEHVVFVNLHAIEDRDKFRFCMIISINMWSKGGII
jgi:hypothetical protein